MGDCRVIRGLHAREFLCRRLIQPGDLVFTESPTYDRTLTLLRRHKATVVGIPTGPDGPDVDALETELKKHVPKFFYLIPDFQNPAGATCSGETPTSRASRRSSRPTRRTRGTGTPPPTSPRCDPATRRCCSTTSAR